MDPRIQETNIYRVVTSTGILGKWKQGEGEVPYTADSPKEAWHIARQLASLGQCMSHGGRLIDDMCVLERKYIFPPAEALNPDKTGLLRSNFTNLTVWVRVAVGCLSQGWIDEPGGGMVEVLEENGPTAWKRTAIVCADLDPYEVLQAYDVDFRTIRSRLHGAQDEYNRQVKIHPTFATFPIVIEFTLYRAPQRLRGMLRICATPDVWQKVWNRYERPQRLA